MLGALCSVSLHCFPHVFFHAELCFAYFASDEKAVLYESLVFNPGLIWPGHHRVCHGVHGLDALFGDVEVFAQYFLV